MRLINLWDTNDNEILIDMDVRRTEQKVSSVREWMDARIKWGKPMLVVTGVVTALSIGTMILKHI